MRTNEHTDVDYYIIQRQDKDNKVSFLSGYDKSAKIRNYNDQNHAMQFTYKELIEFFNKLSGVIFPQSPYDLEDETLSVIHIKQSAVCYPLGKVPNPAKLNSSKEKK